jgi:hypothetical protein
MACLAAGLLLSLIAAGVAGYWLFNPPAWWPKFLDAVAGGPRSR